MKQGLVERAEAVLRDAVGRWGDRVALATSFQIGGTILIDMASRVAPGLRVLTVDTGRLPEETYALIEKVRRRYGLDVEILFPEHARVEDMVRGAGPDLFRRSVSQRLECCRVRKVEPLERALRDLDAWITGARRDQSAARAELSPIAPDPLRDGVLKVAPLAGWSEDDVWRYVRARNLPVHELYGHGYRSIGCAPCTRAVLPGEDPRAGRWWWETDVPKECGLHPRRDPSADGS